MSCKYEFQGKIYTEKQLRKLLQEKGIQNQIETMLQSEEESYSPYSIDDDFTNDDWETSSADDFKPAYEKMNRYKQSLIDMYKNRISNLVPAIKQLYKDGDIIKAEKYELLKVNLENRIKELTNEIKKFNDKNPMSLTELRYQAMIDLARVSELLNTGTLGSDPYLNKEIFENAEEAKRIINYYKAMELVRTNKTLDNTSIAEHPFFMNEEIYDEDGLPTKLSQEIQETLNTIAADFKYYEQQLDNTYKSIVTQVVNSNPNIKRIYGKDLTYEEITAARKDLPWVDALFFDMAKGGITGDNGVITQVSMALFTGTWDEAVSEYKSFEEKHDRLIAKVQKALIRLNQSLRILGQRRASFDIFFQKQNGKKTGKLVQRYSAEFIRTSEFVQQVYEKKLELAMEEEDLSKRDKMLVRAFEAQQNWLRENTLVFDIRKIPEIAAQFPEFAEYFIEDDGHTDKLRETIGDKGYEKELQNQIDKLKQFSKWKHNYTLSYLTSQGVSSVKNLTEEQLDFLNYEIMMNNPFQAVATIYETNPPKFKGLIVNPVYKYNTYIPRRNKVTIDRKKSFATKKYHFNESSENTGYYDENYEAIEAEPDLLEYHELISNELQDIYDSFPEDVKKKLFSHSLISTKATISEIFANPNMSFIQKIVKAAQEFWDGLKSGFGINNKSSVLYDNTDVITNKLDLKVNDDFISTNKKKIDDKAFIERTKLSKILNRPIYAHTFIDYYSLSPVALNYLTDLLDLKNPLELLNKFGNSIPVGKLIENAVIADTVESQSINLPKIIKYYSKMAHEYNARQKMLPYMKILKEHYETIQKLKTRNSSVIKFKNGKPYTDGAVRTVANTQLQEWFDRVVLGEYGDDGIAMGYEGMLNKNANNEKRKNLIEKIKAITQGKILTKEEKRLKKEINDLIEKEDLSDDEINNLKKIRESLGKNPAVSAMFSSFLSYLRIIRMGYNINSAITNFIEGQTANMIIASSGDYFESKHFYRAWYIVQGSIAKSIAGNYAKGLTKSAFKTRILVDRYDMLQDSTNELQKAGIKTPLDKFSKLSPMETNKRTEYLNQTPIMVAILLDTQIVGLDGTTSSVWDALDQQGKLKPNFKTEENIEAWENGKGEKYKEFKLKLNNAIIAAHGNYAELRGMMVKKNLLGKAFMFLKTWMTTQIYQRIAFERDDIETGIKGWKGRYWSHTPASGAIHGVVAAATIYGFGGIPLLIGGTAGLVFGSYTGAQTQLGLLGGMAFTLKALARKLVGIPVNIVSATLTGKQVISDTAFEKFIHTTEDKDGIKKFTERDAKNMKALMSDMAMSLGWMFMLLAVKSLFWDDDDEKDGEKRQIHNWLSNKTIQLMESSTMYINMVGLKEQMFDSNAVFDYCHEVAKYVDTFQKYLRGEISSSKNAEKFQKLILPSVFRDTSFGFSKLMERQFIPTPFDDLFADKEKIERKKIEVLRQQYREELESEKLSDGRPKYSEKQIKKLLDKKHKLPKDVKNKESKDADESVKEIIDKELRNKQREAFREEMSEIKEELDDTK